LYKKNIYTFVAGEMAERSNAAVLKTVVLQGTGGSNPSFSAGQEPRKFKKPQNESFEAFLLWKFFIFYHFFSIVFYPIRLPEIVALKR
jgi:hypothetical protein